MAQLRLVRFQDLTAMDIKITVFWKLQGYDEAAGCSKMFIRPSKLHVITFQKTIIST